MQTLEITLNSIENPVKYPLHKSNHVGVRVEWNEERKDSKMLKVSPSTNLICFKETICLKSNGSETDVVRMKLLSGEKQVMGELSWTLKELLGSRNEQSAEFKNKCTVKFNLCLKQNEKSSTKDKNNTSPERNEKVNIEDGTNGTLLKAPQDGFTRPSLLRLEYYYESSKMAVDYSKKIRFIAPMVHFGENSINYVLARLHVKPLEEMDGTITPYIETMDAKIDQSMAKVGDVLLKGQSKLLDTKNYTVQTITDSKNKTVDTVSNVANITSTKLVHAKDSTIQTVAHVTSTTYGSLSKATSNTYHAISSATVSVISHIPIIGKRLI